jgi:two-component system phosphate regulon response regulator PhoB
MTKHLVIIDDEETCRILYTHLLRNIPGVKIIAEFENAEQALVQIPEMKVDIVIVDYVLPGMSGIEFAERLQKFTEIKVLIVTGHECEYRGPLNIVLFIKNPTLLDKEAYCDAIC